MPQGVGYRDALSRLSQFAREDSAARSSAISDAAARGLGQKLPGEGPLPMGGQYGTEPDAPLPHELERGRVMRQSSPTPPGEARLTERTMAASTPNNSSLDELRNYAMIRSRGAAQAPDPARTPAMVDYEAARQRAVETVRGGGPSSAGGGGMESSPGTPPPAVSVDPEKQALLDELEAAGNRTSAEIGAIGQGAPGTSRALAGELDGRKQEILARLAAIAPAPMPTPQAPPAMAAAPQAQAYPMVASAPPIAPVPPMVAPAPAATFPLIPPPIYPQVSYPTPRPPNIPALDASADYARFRLGR